MIDRLIMGSKVRHEFTPYYRSESNMKIGKYSAINGQQDRKLGG